MCLGRFHFFARPRAGSRSRGSAALLALGLLLSVLASGSPLAAQEAARIDLNLPLLLDLPGDLIFIRYTPGTLDRSASVQKRFEIVTKEFSRTGFQRNSMVIYVLSRDDWKESGLRETYGLPLPLGLDAIVLPGTPDADLVKSFRELLGGELPPTEGKPILTTPDESAALAASDVVAQLEVIRMLAKRAHLAGDAPWIEPLAVHLAARLTWDRYEPGRYTKYAAVIDRLAANDRTPGGHRLADWHDGLPLVERAWFDARFVRGADVLARKTRAGKLWKMLFDATMHTKPLTEKFLLEKYPELAAWKAESFAP